MVESEFDDIYDKVVADELAQNTETWARVNRGNEHGLELYRLAAQRYRDLGSDDDAERCKELADGIELKLTG